jgi:hypothetical protein
MGERPKTSAIAQYGTANLRRKGGLHVFGAAGQVGHQEGRTDQITLEIAKLDPPEFPAGRAGGVEVFHAVAPLDLRREQFRRRFDLLVQVRSELLGIVDDLLILLLGAGDTDRLLAANGRGRTLGHRHGDVPAEDSRGGHPIPSV